MKVEIFLGNHVHNNNTDERLERVSNGESLAFYAPGDWVKFLDERKEMLIKLMDEGK